MIRFQWSKPWRGVWSRCWVMMVSTWADMIRFIFTPGQQLSEQSPLSDIWGQWPGGGRPRLGCKPVTQMQTLAGLLISFVTCPVRWFIWFYVICCLWTRLVTRNVRVSHFKNWEMLNWKNHLFMGYLPPWCQGLNRALGVLIGPKTRFWQKFYLLTLIHGWLDFMYLSTKLKSWRGEDQDNLSWLSVL